MTIERLSMLFPQGLGAGSPWLDEETGPAESTIDMSAANPAAGRAWCLAERLSRFLPISTTLRDKPCHR